MPQTPALQAPLQHCAGLPQGLPSPTHEKGPQTLPAGLHGPLQQGSLGLQVTPSGRQHRRPPHTPLLQSLLQQGDRERQVTPSGLHRGAPQIPLGLQVPVQQSEETLHTLPSGRQTGLCAQAPPWQMPVQQSLEPTHAVPTAPHAPPHTPWLHTPSQQAEAVTQLAPTGLQVPLSEPPVLGERLPLEGGCSDRSSRAGRSRRAAWRTPRTAKYKGGACIHEYHRRRTSATLRTARSRPPTVEHGSDAVKLGLTPSDQPSSGSSTSSGSRKRTSPRRLRSRPSWRNSPSWARATKWPHTARAARSSA